MSGVMHPSGMSKVIDGKRYTVNTSTLLADDAYWDGSNYDRHGRNTWLYRTKGGAYFRVDMTMWQGEKDVITALSEREAMQLYEELPEHPVEYEEAFGVMIEEATAGRPPIYDESMKRVIVMMPAEMLTWLRAQPEGISGTVRKLIKAADVS
jgi:hypothetical protein